MSKNKVTILGVGISGLTCAYEFMKKGNWNVRLYDQNSIPGGMARTERYKEFHYDLGPHLYHTPDKNTEEYWRSNFKDLLVEKQLWSKNYKYGKYIDYPLAWSSINYLSPKLREKIKKEIEKYQKSDLIKYAKNYKEYVTGLVGPTLQKMFFEQYPKKVWGISTEKMSTNWAPKRISFRVIYEPFYYDQFCAVGRFGAGVVPEYMAKKIVEMGGKINYNRRINKIIVDKNRISRIKFEDGEEIKIDDDEIVISTMSINRLSKYLGIESKLKFRAVVLVYLIIKKPFVLPKDIDFVYYDDPKLLFHRLTEQKKYNDDGLPKNSTLVCFEIAADENDIIYSMDNQKLVQKVKNQFLTTSLIKKEDFVEGFVRRIPEVYPVQSLGYEIERAKIMGKLESIPNLYITGSTAEFGYFDMQILFCKSRDLVDLITKSSSMLKDRKETKFVELNKSVELKNIKIGSGYPVFIIAEAGMNHNGSVAMGKKLIEEAKKAGCNAIKFQSFKAESRVSAKVKAAKYVEKVTELEENYYEMFKKFELNQEQHKELFDYSKKVGILMFSTPFDEEHADLLDKLGVSIFKIASMDLTNIPLIRHIAKKGKPIIISTGMGTLGEIEEALDAIRTEGNQNVVLLHCISAYPCPPEHMNLKAIDTLRETFKIPIGLSDHSIGGLIPISAVTRGIICIEKHFTLDNRLEGPDHIFSANPETMKQIVEDIRVTEKAQGIGLIKRENIEYATAQLFKKSIFANQDIKYGTVIERDMLTVKGPALGIKPKFMDIVVGRKAKKNILADFPIYWDDI